MSLGFMYENGRGVLKDNAAALEWYRKAADQGNDWARTRLERLSSPGRDVAKETAEKATAAPMAAAPDEASTRAPVDSTPTIAALVKKYEAAQPAMSAPDAERAMLAREIAEAARRREKLSYLPARFSEGASDGNAIARLTPNLREAIIATALASFRPDRIRTSWERWLAEELDAPTLRIGLQWERSELGSRINRLELEAEAPEQAAARKEFVVQFIKRGAPVDDTRGRACAQKDILDGSAEAALPFLEAMAATGAMVVSVQQAPSPDMDMVGQLIVAIRPMLRDTARQASLAECLFTLRSLSDAEFDQVLDFLRTDAGGRYARGSNVAMRHALLDVTDVFTRTMVDVARQLKGGGEI
jgi:Sel1 repeat